LPPEPLVTWFGLANQSYVPLDPINPGGDPLIYRLDPGPDGTRFGFQIVVEGRYGGTHDEIGQSTFNWDPSDPTVLPDLQIETSRDLGDGGVPPTPVVVCDDENHPPAGGVSGIPTPDFSSTQAVADAINDFACRFKDGTGYYSGVAGSSALTTPDRCSASIPPNCTVNPLSTIQFVAFVDKPFRFPSGDTLLTARVRDVAGRLSAPSSIIVRVANP
jgi:hypothetical protein